MPHVCVVVNSRHSGFYTQDPHAREQTVQTSDAVCVALGRLGHSVTVAEAGPSLLERLNTIGPDVVLNLATGYRSKKDQASIAAMLEISGIPYTGSGPGAHLIGLHKHLAKLVMGIHGVPTPRFRVIDDSEATEREVTEGLSFPLIVKPASEGSSAGISEESVVATPEAALEQVRQVESRFGLPVLVEEFVSGREFTVGMVGYPEPVVLPVEEIEFRRGRMFTYDVKSRDAVRPVCPAEIPPEAAVELQRLAIKTFHAVGCVDFARVDFRVSSDGSPYVLEINTLPGLMPGYSELPRMADMAGISFTDLVGRLLEGPLSRRSQPAQCYRREATL